MKALLVSPPASGVRLGEAPEPSAGPGELKVRLLECGICGTDRDIVAGKYGTPPPGRTDLILGHENLGRVVEVGAQVPDFRVGDLVVATVRRGCGICRYCRANRSDFCETGLFTERGIKARDGYLTEFYVEQPEYVVHVPRAHRLSAVLLEPLSVVEKAVAEGRRVLGRLGPAPPGTDAGPSAPTALVTGTGAVGMLAALVLAAEGFSVTAIDRHDDRTPAARLLAQVGVAHVDVSAGLSALKGRTFDLIVEASGSPSLDVALIGLLPPNGALVLTGIPPEGPVPGSGLDGGVFRSVVLGNRAIVGSVNANRRHFESGLRHLTAFRTRWGTLAEQLVSRRLPLGSYSDALGGKAEGTIKTVLTLSD